MTAPKQMFVAIGLALLLLLAGIGALTAFGQIPEQGSEVAPEQDAAVQLIKTVGTDPAVCATTDSIEVAPFTEVVYCFTAINIGEQALVVHNLEDSHLGTILTDFSYVLDPAASVSLTVPVTIETATVVNTATWSANTAGGLLAVASDTAQVTVHPPSIDVTKTVGLDPLACSTEDSAIVLAGTEVVYCYEVTNTGWSALPLHTVVDDQLGTILSSFPYTLTPGASVYITVPATINANTVNEVTWTASDPELGLTATATDTARVDVIDVEVDKTLLGPYSNQVVIGEPAVFEIDITNTGVATVTDLVLTDVFSSTCMLFEDGTPPPSAQAPNILSWTNLLTPTGILEPGESISVTLTFSPTDACDVSENTATIGVLATVGGQTAKFTRTDVAEFSITQPEAYIGGHVFLDSNANCIYEPWRGETGIGGVTVTRTGGFSTTSNNYDGWYAFYLAPSLLPGNFSVTVTPPPGYSTNCPTTLTTYVVNGAHISNLSFGLVSQPPSIDFVKTVGLDPGVCAATGSVTVPEGTDVTYCFAVTNTSAYALPLHDLEDSELGMILDGFAYSLLPNETVEVTQTVAIDASVVNTATWTAYFAGGPSVSASDTAEVIVEPPSIDFVKTVGLDADVCATTDSVTVIPGTEVTYCFAVTNSNTYALPLHDLADSELGVILDGFAYDLAPGETVEITRSATITETTINTATWMAYFAGGPSVTASDTAEVIVEPPSIDFVKTVGLDPNVCATTDSVTVPEGSEVTYCFAVTNTGTYTLPLHDLEDSELGAILDGFAYDLAPNETVEITQTVTIDASVVNTATWTAYFMGGPSVSASDTAEVTATPVYTYFFPLILID